MLRTICSAPTMARRIAPLWLIVLGASCFGDDKPIIPVETAKILSFDADPKQLRAGDSATLRWETRGVNGVAIEPSVGLQPPTGEVKIRPIATTTYTLKIRNGEELISSQVTVEVSGGAPHIEQFQATPRTIQTGEHATLSWSTSNAETVTLDPDLGPQPGTGSVDVSPQSTTLYRLTASSGVGQVSQSVTVVVASGGQPSIKRFTASSQSVGPGDLVTLSWETVQAESVTINPDIGAQPANGSVDVRPQQTTVYSLVAVGPGGMASASLTITVAMTGEPEIIRFDVDPATITPGGSATLSWETDNASGVIIDPGLGPQPAKADLVVSPAVTTVYTLHALGATSEATRDITLTVAAPSDAVITTFAASPQAVTAGGSTTLSWTTQNSASVDVEPGVGRGLMPNASVQVSPAQTTEYVLTAHPSGSGASASARLTVSVAAAPPEVTSFTAQPASITAGQSSTLSWRTTGTSTVEIDQGIGRQPTMGSVQVSPSQTTSYQLTATGPGGQVRSMVSVSVSRPGAPVISSFSAAPSQVMPGSPATLSWATTGATSVRIDNGIGVVATSGMVTVRPPVTTTFTLTADGPGGTATAPTTVSVSSPNGDQCSSAFEIRQSGVFTGNTQTAVNDYSAATSCTNFVETGPDQAYRLSLQAGDRVRASLTPTGGWDAALYLVTSCSSIDQSCVAGEDNGNPEIVDYTAPSAGTYYLIVDGFGTAAGAYSLDVTLNPAPLPNDQCAGAIDVGRGGTFAGNTLFARNNYDPLAGGCTSYAEAGNDVTYRVALAAGERLSATLTTTWDSALYLLQNCASAPTSCPAGSDRGNPESINFTAVTAGTYYLVVDGFASAAGDFSLVVTVSPPAVGGDTCPVAVQIPAGGGSFSGTTQGLAADYAPPLSCTGRAEAGPDRVYVTTLARGDIVEASAGFQSSLDGALYAVTSCGALSSCVAGSDVPGTGRDEDLRFVARAAGDHYLVVDANQAAQSGTHDLTVLSYHADTCQTAAPIHFGTPEWMTTTGLTNDYSPNAGGCTGAGASGEDRAYSVILRAGDQLRATLTPDAGYDASLYLVSSCADVTGSCLWGSDHLGAVAETIAPVVQQGGTYFLIADGFAGSDGTGTLTATIAHGDTCQDAYFVPPNGGTFRGTTAGYAANVGTSVRAGSCTGWQQSGADAVYRVSLAAGQRLQATLTTTWDASLYLITDCAQSATSCVAGRDAGNPEVLDFTSPTARTYYLVVDSWQTGSSNTGNYSLAVTVQ